MNQVQEVFQQLQLICDESQKEKEIFEICKSIETLNYENQIELYDKLSQEKEENKIIIYERIGKTYYDKKNYEKAIKNYELALPIYKKHHQKNFL